MKTKTLSAFLIVLGAFSSASDAAAVSWMPDHPMADVMGMVLADENSTGLTIESYSDSPLNPPYQAGWPVDIAGYSGDEGGLLVNADGDSELEILFRTHKTLHLLDSDGTYLPGWPVTMPGGTHSTGQPAFGDLDGDGEGEIVAISDNYPNGSTGWTWAYHTDGTLLPGFPAMTAGDHTKSPTVVDLFDDGTCEIIVSDRDYPIGRVYLFSGIGQIQAGWPIPIDHVPAASAGAADLNNDGVREIVFQSYSTIYAWDPYGTLLTGFPYTPSTGDVFSYSAPTFADIDNDGYLEIASGGHNMSGSSHMLLLNHDGTDVAGWPKAVSYWIYAPATFADMDGDGDLEVLVGDQVLSTTLTDHLYAWHHDGTAVAGWPVGPVEAINSQVAVADIDGDGDPEFIWDTNITPGKLLGYHHTGVPISGWPITTDGASFFNTAALGDVDCDGDIELLLPTNLDTPLCTAHLWDFPDQVDPMDVQMPMFQYGPGRDGLIFCPEQQGIGETEAPGQMVLTAAPNPFSSSVEISMEGIGGDPGTLCILDLSGRKVAELEPRPSRDRILYTWSPAAAFPTGVYTVLSGNDGERSAMRLLRL
ncbi:MAG: VCBS repeat-containing protein [Candidatus Fermentibacteraceae bacterium]|nr:VCBS repeat-containing protein [Candidatus Fermentibacteraceae bacterium]MBN2608133.1 VCBS repeat-containing protein [Candidatus Fermentibacteraceae bacterium]